jgi:hypothetical protein
VLPAQDYPPSQKGGGIDEYQALLEW